MVANLRSPLRSRVRGLLRWLAGHSKVTAQLSRCKAVNGALYLSRTAAGLFVRSFASAVLTARVLMSRTGRLIRQQPDTRSLPQALTDKTRSTRSGRKALG